MMRRRPIALAAWIFLIPAFAYGLELPDAPAGFSWHEVSAIRGAFLVPDGWYFQEEVQGETRAIFITRESIPEVGLFETGVSINVITDNPSAPAHIKAILEVTAASNSVELSWDKIGPFVKLSCQFESLREGGLEPTRNFMIGLVNLETGTTYLIVFESPKSAWEEMWPKGKTILDALALEEEV